MKKIAFMLTLLLGGCSSSPVPPPPPALVTITQPVVCDTPLYLEYIGHLEANFAIQVLPQIQGYIVSRHFKDGDAVKEGDLLFVIDPRPYQAALQKAEATLAQNLASLKYAEDTAQRNAKLLQEEYVAQLQYDQFITNVLEGEAIIKENLADIDIAKINLDYCYIRAPMNCITGVTIVDVGNFVQPEQNQPIITLTQITPIKVSFYLPEKELQKVEALQRKSPLATQVFLHGDFSKPYLGKLAVINNQVQENTGTVLLQALLPNEDKVLWPGQFVDVRLILDIAKDALLIPKEALQIGPEGPFLFIVKADHTVEQRSVVVGQRTGEEVIIKKGLKADETVVLNGQINLHPGAAVAIKGQGGGK